MPVTVRSGDILFNNGTTQSTAATASSFTAGDVGTYALARNTSSSAISFGGTIGGGSLSPAGLRSIASNVNVRVFQSGSLSGTWRCMGFSSYFNSCCGQEQSVTLWLRIS
jgi:hypothetical protein